MDSSNLQLWLTSHVSMFGLLPSPVELLGYVGLGPGPEFIPHFLALLSFVGVALIAVLQWPISVLIGLRARRRRKRQSEPRSNAESLLKAEGEATPRNREVGSGEP